jgi:hypothetical protein
MQTTALVLMAAGLAGSRGIAGNTGSSPKFMQLAALQLSDLG